MTVNNIKARASCAFKTYVAHYDAKEISIALKIAHTYRVADISERIAASLLSEQTAINFAWLLGLLHDIGRFEQFTQYGTFKDLLSIDHAELGADILFCDGLIEKFFSQEDWSLTQEEFFNFKRIAETAIRLHNKLKIPNDLDAQTELYTKILRDADKLDIFRVITEPPYEEHHKDLSGLVARPEVMQCVMKHRCVPRSSVRANDLEILIAQCCMAFELEFPESRKIACEQGYLMKLLEMNSKFLAIVKSEILNVFGKDFFES